MATGFFSRKKVSIISKKEEDDCDHPDDDRKLSQCDNPDHGKAPSVFYCGDCDQQLCTRCCIKEHGEHRVLVYRDKEATMSKLHHQETELVKLKAERVKTKEDKEKAEEDRFDDLAFSCTEKISILFNQIQDHDAEWGKLVVQVEKCRVEMERHRSEKETKEAERKREKEKLEQISREKDRRIQEIKTKFEKDVKIIDEAIRGVASLQTGVQKNIEQGELLITERHCRSIADIVKAEKMLQELAVDAEVDRVTDLKAKMLLDSSATRIGGRDIPDSKYIVFGVTFVTGNRIAMCGHSSGSWTVRLWEVISDTTETVLESDYRIRRTAYLGNNTVVGLSRTSPVLRIIDLITKEVRGIEVNLNENVMNKLWNVAVDDRGYFLITYGKGDKKHLILVSKERNILRDIETGYPYMQTFCRRRAMVVLCGNTCDTLSCYKLHDDNLTEVMSARHGVKGFLCYDICSGSMGEIFIVGVMEGDKPREIRLYQLDIEEEKKQVEMRRIELVDADNDMRSYDVPRCCVIDDKVVIGYDNKLASFRLS